LDCVWARLPVVATRGDTLGELIERHGLGRTVPPADAAAMAAALEELLVDQQARAAARTALDELSPRFRWHVAPPPLRQFGDCPRVAPDRDDPRIRRQLRRQKTATSPRSAIARDWAMLRTHFDQGGVGQVARQMTGRLRRQLRR